MPNSKLPLLPLILDDVPPGLCQALTQEGVPFRRRDEADARGRFLLVDSRRGPCRPGCDGQTIIDVDLLRQGFDLDPFEQLTDTRAAENLQEVVVPPAAGYGPHRLAGVEDLQRPTFLRRKVPHSCGC